MAPLTAMTAPLTRDVAPSSRADNALQGDLTLASLQSQAKGQLRDPLSIQRVLANSARVTCPRVYTAPGPQVTGILACSPHLSPPLASIGSGSTQLCATPASGGGARGPGPQAAASSSGWRGVLRSTVPGHCKPQLSVRQTGQLPSTRRKNQCHVNPGTPTAQRHGKHLPCPLPLGLHTSPWWCQPPRRGLKQRRRSHSHILANSPDSRGSQLRTLGPCRGLGRAQHCFCDQAGPALPRVTSARLAPGPQGLAYGTQIQLAPPISPSCQSTQTQNSRGPGADAPGKSLTRCPWEKSNPGTGSGAVRAAGVPWNYTCRSWKAEAPWRGLENQSASRQPSVGGFRLGD